MKETPRFDRGRRGADAGSAGYGGSSRVF